MVGAIGRCGVWLALIVCSLGAGACRELELTFPGNSGLIVVETEERTRLHLVEDGRLACDETIRIEPGSNGRFFERDYSGAFESMKDRCPVELEPCSLSGVGCFELLPSSASYRFDAGSWRSEGGSRPPGFPVACDDGDGAGYEVSQIDLRAGSATTAVSDAGDLYQAVDRTIYVWRRVGDSFENSASVEAPVDVEAITVLTSSTSASPEIWVAGEGELYRQLPSGGFTGPLSGVEWKGAVQQLAGYRDRILVVSDAGLANFERSATSDEWRLIPGLPGGVSPFRLRRFEGGVGVVTRDSLWIDHADRPNPANWTPLSPTGELRMLAISTSSIAAGSEVEYQFARMVGGAFGPPMALVDADIAELVSDKHGVLVLWSDAGGLIINRATETVRTCPWRVGAVCEDARADNFGGRIYVTCGGSRPRVLVLKPR